MVYLYFRHEYLMNIYKSVDGKYFESVESLTELSLLYSRM